MTGVEELTSLVSNRLLAAARRHGDEGAARSLAILPSENSVFISNQDDIQTGASLSLVIGADRLERSLPRLDLMLLRTLRARARLRAIGGIEDADHAAPAWSFTIHRLLAQVIRNAGGDPMWLIPSAYQSGGEKMLKLAIEPRGITISGVHAVAGRILVDLVQIDTSPHTIIWDNESGCGINVGVRLPLVLTQSLAGRPLSEIISMPFLGDDADIEVSDATVDATTTIGIADAHEPIRQLPADIDGRWLRIGYHC